MESVIPKVPPALICPISNLLFKDPVIAADGHTYERQAIIKWFDKSKISPMTGKIIETNLLQNIAIRGQSLQLRQEINNKIIDQKIRAERETNILEELKSLVIGQQKKRNQNCLKCGQLQKKVNDLQRQLKLKQKMEHYDLPGSEEYLSDLCSEESVQYDGYD